MRTIVELYDKEPVENILSACIFKPEMIVFICDVKDNTLRKEQAVYRLFKSCGLKTKARFYYIDTTDVGLIARVLRAVVRDYPGCVFDFSGGKDLVLLTAGIFCKENKIPGFYIDIDAGRFIDIDACSHLEQKFKLPSFRAEDIFALAGSTLLGYGHFALSEMDDDFSSSVLRIWKLVMENPEAWSGLVGFFQAASSGAAEMELSVRAPEMIRVNAQTTARCNMPLLLRVAQCGAIEKLVHKDGRVSFCYKSALMKKCLQNHGIWLELYGYLTAKNSGYFSDVRTSVVVGWDDDARGTRNEIDILLIKDITPVFISCKMGLPTPLALSEIKILSEKFGGQRTRTVLLTAADVRSTNRALAQRAQDLDIFLLDRADLQQEDLLARFQAIASR